jgi:hypothetical protein
VRDVEKASLTRLGRLVRRASQSGFDVQLVDELPENRCVCPANQTPSSKWSKFTIRQILFAMTVLGVTLALFRHPLSQVVDEDVWKSAVGPWTVIGNFLFDTPIIDPRPHFDKSVMSAVVFTISTPLAVLSVFFLLQAVVRFMYLKWLEVSDD